MYLFAVFAPLLGFLIAGILGRKIGDRMSQFITCLLMGLSALLSAHIFMKVAMGGEVIIKPLFTWIEVGNFKAVWRLKFDSLSTLMLAVVSSISFVIHLYSVGYMAKDRSIPRFMGYLSLFTFMMYTLVTADNLLQLFFGWEGVGLTSYLLIGYWYERDSANAAAIKAFIMNRIGDFALVLGLAVIFATFQTFDIGQILKMASAETGHTIPLLGQQVKVLDLIGILLFIGAMGKSAQLGLHTWLPDAMEGPTPVSALIHAATMVTAGVYLVVRMSPLYEVAPVARDVMIIVGASTAFFAGTVALTQNDIKRVIAYSTCSQLGYMFFAVGVTAYSAAIFHLVTHAFFKALLFLGAGAVIHGLSDEQDLRKMGGIWKEVPLTYTAMWVGSLALAGIPFFAGYFSKDMILNSTWIAQTPISQYAFILGMSTVFLTAFYSWRLLWMAFHGKSRAEEKVLAHVHEPPTSMVIPMFLLAMGAIFAGLVPDRLEIFSEHAEKFWNGVVATPITPEILSTAPHWVALAAVGLAFLGIILAVLFYGPISQVPQLLANRLQALYQFSFNKWYFDEIYEWTFVRTGLHLGGIFWRHGDGSVIDGYGPDGVASTSRRLANYASQLQTGYIYHYALAMASGVALIGMWYLLF